MSVPRFHGDGPVAPLHSGKGKARARHCRDDVSILNFYGHGERRRRRTTGEDGFRTAFPSKFRLRHAHEREEQEESRWNT